jgi:hypothetical protein
MEPLGYLSAMSTIRQGVLSARPDAPVVPDRPPRWRNSSTVVRRAGADVLRRLADRVEPRQSSVGAIECS